MIIIFLMGSNMLLLNMITEGFISKCIVPLQGLLPNWFDRLEAGNPAIQAINLAPPAGWRQDSSSVFFFFLEVGLNALCVHLKTECGHHGRRKRRFRYSWNCLKLVKIYKLGNVICTWMENIYSSIVIFCFLHCTYPPNFPWWLKCIMWECEFLSWNGHKSTQNTSKCAEISHERPFNSLTECDSDYFTRHQRL